VTGDMKDNCSHVHLSFTTLMVAFMIANDMPVKQGTNLMACSLYLSDMDMLLTAIFVWA